MPNQIIDIVDVGIPGPAGDASPEMIAAAEARAGEVAVDVATVQVAEQIADANIPGVVAGEVQRQTIPAAENAGRQAAIDALNDNPAIISTAQAAAEAWAEDADLLRQSWLGSVRTVSSDDSVYSEVSLSWDYRTVGGILRGGGVVASSAGWIATTVPSGSGEIAMTKDYRRAEVAAAPNGRMPENLVSALADRIMLPGIESGIVCLGDSMTMDYAGIGTSFAGALGVELGVVSTNLGFAGDTPQQIAWRYGTFEARLTVVGGVIPATGTVVAEIEPGPGWFRGRTFLAYVADSMGERLKVQLVQSYEAAAGDTPDWTIAQVDGTGPKTILSGTRIMGELGVDEAMQARPLIVRFGRNDTNAARGGAALESLLGQRRDLRRRTLVLPIYNNAGEPSGSSGYSTVMATNERYADIAGEAWFDLRKMLIEHGLSIAGITPTADDVTAIGQDRIPPSLMYDGTHLNAAGRLADARLVGNEIKARNW